MNIFCQYCPRREDLRREAVLRSKCHPCAQTQDRGVRCRDNDIIRHHVFDSPGATGELLKPGRKRLLWRLLERAFLS